MAPVLTYTREVPAGFQARKLRISRLITQRELANLAGVSLEEVDSFEHNLPVKLDARRKILKELWTRKALK